ncbi:hypothetical protein Tco_1308174 [Tanacetum coccineum]
MTSRFESWNGEVLCKNVSLIDAGPSVEENTILFMEAQDRPGDKEQTILFMEAQDCAGVEEKAFIQNGTTRSERLDFRLMTSRFESWNREVLCKNLSLIDAGPSVKENTILFMEAQDRMKKRPLFKMA